LPQFGTFSILSIRQNELASSTSSRRQRIEWIQLSQRQYFTICCLARHWSCTKLPEDNARKIQEDSDILRLQVRLQLNPYDKADLRLIALLNDIPKRTGRADVEHMDIPSKSSSPRLRSV
jgi:hypothetical protein